MNVNSKAVIQQTQLKEMNNISGDQGNGMRSFILGIGLLFSINLTLLASGNGEELFIQKCASCHSINIPSDRSQMVAPPAKGIMFHMSEVIGSDEKVLEHIQSFTMNPTEEKAICKSVRRFGLMPSQKDLITEEELKIVAHWMIENLKISKEDYNKQKQVKKTKKQCD